MAQLCEDRSKGVEDASLQQQLHGVGHDGESSQLHHLPCCCHRRRACQGTRPGFSNVDEERDLCLKILSIAQGTREGFEMWTKVKDTDSEFFQLQPRAAFPLGLHTHHFVRFHTFC